MGIAGLLPALKPIQVTRHLSELAGQTIAVDAYVWLHKGIYSCATELATGKPTHKYVDYAMHRVRLLRHHKIEPYIVFDGGPLPAKQGTESTRKHRRDEYLARGRALTSQSKHAQAREFYVKCVDVTPQMAYQLIKALRAENVAYIVAPYEADAQLAYLERIGLADGILTEDSDLLVYGCKTVLFKLDPVAATVVSISREDFASVTLSSSDISLVGWSDVQFRAMAILSGCDYLPSIHGIGLKTACSLLRKWKTVEQVIKALMLEGKKSVPKDYLQQYEKAEKCFLHQRVYCPLTEKVVHLTNVNEMDWSDEYDAYVGGLIDLRLAKKLAIGDIDPVNLLPMNDINPSYVPNAAARTTRLQLHNTKRKIRSADVIAPKDGCILNFFGANAFTTSCVNVMSEISVPVTVPRATSLGNGKRTLAEVLEQDIAIRNQKHKLTPSNQRQQGALTQSKFFMDTNGGFKHRTSLTIELPPVEEKENLFRDLSSTPDLKWSHCDRLDVDDDGLISEASHRADDGGELIDLNVGNGEMVKQEDGYISPLEMDDTEISAPELSSPVRPSKRRKGHLHADNHAKQANVQGDENDLEDFEALSSPPPAAKALILDNLFGQWEHRNDKKKVAMVAGVERRHSFPPSSVQRAKRMDAGGGKSVEASSNTCFAEHDESEDRPNREQNAASSKIGLSSGHVTQSDDTMERHARNRTCDTGSSIPSPSPETPENERLGNIPLIINVDDDEPDPNGEARVRAVIDGWKSRWARPQHPQTRSTKFSETAPKSTHGQRSFAAHLKRNETNVTPSGRLSLKGGRLQSGTAERPFGKRVNTTFCIDDKGRR
ncbi:hypothetical protein APHAL10511_006736 [Amanita phalloides]|nr:hypothetical protein APHAL10511_006736 [Amanita phalloides]